MDPFTRQILVYPLSDRHASLTTAASNPTMRFEPEVLHRIGSTWDAVLGLSTPAIILNGGHDYDLTVKLTDDGIRCLAALDGMLVWDALRQEVDHDSTLEFWMQRLTLAPLSGYERWGINQAAALLTGEFYQDFINEALMRKLGAPFE